MTQQAGIGRSGRWAESLAQPLIGRSISILPQHQDFGVTEGFEVGSNAKPSCALFGARVFWVVFSRVTAFGLAPFAIGCHAVGVVGGVCGGMNSVLQLGGHWGQAWRSNIRG